MYRLHVIALALAATAIVMCRACDDTHGMHCLSGKWECPGDLFDKVGRNIKETFCSNVSKQIQIGRRLDKVQTGNVFLPQKCCLCIKTTGAVRCTPDDLLPNKEIFINPNFQDFPRKGTCQWCPKGTEKTHYTHKCFDQRSVGFENQLNDCKTYPIVKGYVLPNGIGNVGITA